MFHNLPIKKGKEDLHKSKFDSSIQVKCETRLYSTGK